MSGPYANHAHHYREAGWQGVLPVIGKSSKLPDGYTGHHGAWPDDDTIDGWVTARGNDNIALRLPEDVIGIDIDAYDGRAGLDTITTWERIHECELPPTWHTSSRDDGSRIAYYRVPTGGRWRSDLGTGSNVEIIQHRHRYAIVAPSTHPHTGKTYQWRVPAGDHTGTIPTPGELTALPLAWITALAYPTRATATRNPATHDGTTLERDNHHINGERGPVDVHRILAGDVPPGEQQAELFRYMCALRARNMHRDEMVVLGLVAVQGLTNAREDDPWTPAHVHTLVDRVCREYEAGTSTPATAIDPAVNQWAQNFTNTTNTNRTTPDTSGESDGDTPNTPPKTVTQSIREEPPRVPFTTDLGNSLRMVAHLGDHIRYAVDENRWYVWDERRWAPDRTNNALNLTKVVIDSIRYDADRVDGDDRKELLKWATTSEDIARRRAMLAGAQSEPALTITGDQLDTDPHLLVVHNGTIDLHTGTIRESRREDLCSRLAAVTHQPEAEAPLWEDHVTMVCNGDPRLIAYIRRCIGYTLTGDVGARSFFSLEGNGSNGKNALIEPIMGILGTYARTASTSLLTGGDEQHPTILADLMGARLVFIDEVKQGKPLNAERIKALVGSKRITARRMRSDSFEYEARFKLWMAGNGQPTIRDTSDGVWNRMHRVVCHGTVNPTKLIHNYSDILYNTEASGILNWALTGLTDWRTRGNLGTPDTVLADVQAFRDEEDNVAMFVEDRLTITGDPADFIANSDLHFQYKVWAEGEGIHARDIVNGVHLGRRLSAMGITRDPGRRVNGVQTRGMVGVALSATVLLQGTLGGYSQ